MTFSLSRFSENLLENFDTDLQVFYRDVLSKELNLLRSSDVAQVRQALKVVVNAYKKETVNSKSSEIFFDSSEKRCAYILKHCPCFGSAVAKYFLQLLRKNPDVLDRAVHSGQVNLCCLGGGPGTEAVAVAKIVGLLMNNAAGLSSSKEKIHLRVRVVDLSEEWRTTAKIVLRTAQKTSALCGDSGRMQISFDLIQADLTEPFEDRVRKELLEADIITMVYFVSAVNGSRAQSKCTSMLQNIMSCAKPGALLFFLDSAKKLHHDAVMAAASKFQDMRQIYGPRVQEFHSLTMKSIKKFIELYFIHFNAILCLTNCFVTSSGWTKENVEVSPRNGLIESHRRYSSDPSSNARKPAASKNRSWNKTVEYNTRRQERFHQRVEKLLLVELKMDFMIDDLEEIDCCPLEPDCLDCEKKTFYAGKAKRKRIIIRPE